MKLDDSYSDEAFYSKEDWDTGINIRLVLALLNTSDFSQALEIASAIKDETRKQEAFVRIAFAISFDYKGIVSSFDADEKQIAASVTEYFLSH